jgi:hypothetical protein
MRVADLRRDRARDCDADPDMRLGRNLRGATRCRAASLPMHVGGARWIADRAVLKHFSAAAGRDQCRSTRTTGRRHAKAWLPPEVGLSHAGVPVELHMYPRAYHGFYRVTNARVTKQAEHDTREALRRFLHG